MQGTLPKQETHAELLSLLEALLSSGAVPCTPCRRSANPPAGGAAIRLLRSTGGTWPGTHNHGMESAVQYALCPIWISCAADMRGRGVGTSPMPGTRKGPTLSRAKTMPRGVEEGRQHQQDVQRLH